MRRDGLAQSCFVHPPALLDGMSSSVTGCQGSSPPKTHTQVTSNCILVMAFVDIVLVETINRWRWKNTCYTGRAREEYIPAVMSSEITFPALHRNFFQQLSSSNTWFALYLSESHKTNVCVCFPRAKNSRLHLKHGHDQKNNNKTLSGVAFVSPPPSLPHSATQVQQRGGLQSFL